MKNVIQIFLVVGGVAAGVAIYFFVNPIPGFWAQILAVIASAFLGAGVTAWITNTLLDNKRKLEEEKEKNIKVFENKVQVYSEFISKMWHTLEDDLVTAEEIREIRSEIFNKLIFYLKEDEIVKLVDKVGKIKRSDNGDGDDAKITKNNIDCFSDITELLRIDVNDNCHTQSKLISQLWNNFGLEPKDVMNEKIMKGDNINFEQKEPTSSKLSFWHFNMWSDVQIEAFKKGTLELSLVEYDEIWRTNLVRQVKCGDIVFLFRRGGYGYVGVFIVKGWRVISKEDNIIKEIVCVYGTEKEEDDENKIKADIENYDIYKSIDDGATSCANLLVKPLAFDYKGVSYPGGVYRRTISRYDNGYARILLARFKAKENDPTFNTLEKDGEKIKACTDDFYKLTQNITPAERDENGCWK